MLVAAVRPATKSRLKLPVQSSLGLRSHIQSKAFELRIFTMTADFVSNVANSIAQRIGIFLRQVVGHAPRDISRVSIRIGRRTGRISSTPMDCSVRTARIDAISAIFSISMVMQRFWCAYWQCSDLSSFYPGIAAGRCGKLSSSLEASALRYCRNSTNHAAAMICFFAFE